MIQWLRARLGGWETRGAIVVIAAAVLGFCLSGVVPAGAGVAACGDPDPFPKVCAQAGTADLVPAIGIQQVPHLGPAGALLSVPLLRAPASEAIPQIHADPSAPRAPPAFLA